MAARSPQRLQFLGYIATDGTTYDWLNLIEFDEKTCTGKMQIFNDDDEEGRARKIVEFGPDDIARGIRMYREYLDGEREGIRGAWAKGYETKGEKVSPNAYGRQLILASDTNGDDGDYDANTADSALQFAFYGNLVYG